MFSRECVLDFQGHAVPKYIGELECRKSRHRRQFCRVDSTAQLIKHWIIKTKKNVKGTVASLLI